MDIDDKVTPLSSEFDYSQVPSWYAICLCRQNGLPLRSEVRQVLRGIRIPPSCGFVALKAVENTVFYGRKRCFRSQETPYPA